MIAQGIRPAATRTGGSDMRQTLSAPARRREYTYRAGLLLGRFQLVTKGHLADAVAMGDASETCYIGIGSVNQSRDTRNSWTFEERCEMWRAALPADMLPRVRFFGQEDLGNGFRWASAIENRMDRAMREDGIDPETASVGLFGHRKDSTSFYLDDFPSYIFENLPNFEGINASDVRDEYLRLGDADFFLWRDGAADKVPGGVLDWLEAFRSTPEYARLAEEARRDDAAMAPWTRRLSPDGPGLPHDVIFNDACAVVVQGNRVLMHKRRSYPGKDLWALPEARLTQREDPVDAAIRIAIVSTGVDLSETRMRKAHRDTWFRSDAYRTTRGRTITFPSAFLLTPTPRGRTPEERRRSMALPRLRASDDVGFFTFDEVRRMRSSIHADHAIIIDQALERLGILRS
jgi:bifunctional NMN adenylyltransferase/nudix hydrolase